MGDRADSGVGEEPSPWVPPEAWTPPPPPRPSTGMPSPPVAGPPARGWSGGPTGPSDQSPDPHRRASTRRWRRITGLALLVALPGLVVVALAWAGDDGDDEPPGWQAAEEPSGPTTSVPATDPGGVVDEAAAERCREQAATVEHPGPYVRRRYLGLVAADACATPAPPGAPPPPSQADPCHDPYRALAPSADEPAWSAADAAAQACYLDDAWLTGEPRLVGDVVVVPGSHVAVGLDPVTGDERWRAPGCSSWLSAVQVEPADLAVLRCRDRSMVALDGATGATRWTVEDPRGHDEPTDRQTAAVGGAGVATVVGDVLEVRDPATGEVRWWTVPDLEHPSLAVTPDLVLAHGVGVLEARDATTGEVRWRRPVDRTTSPAPPAPVVAGDLVALISADGVVTGLDLATGDERWRVPLEVGRGEAVVATTGDLVLATTRTGDRARLWAMDPTSGVVRWSTPPEENVLPPVAADGDLVAATEGCSVVVLGADDGQVRFRAEGTDCTRSFTVAGGRLHQVVESGEEDPRGLTVREHLVVVPG